MSNGHLHDWTKVNERPSGYVECAKCGLSLEVFITKERQSSFKQGWKAALERLLANHDAHCPNRPSCQDSCTYVVELFKLLENPHAK